MNIVLGNAAVDGKPTRQWVIGSFMPDGDLRKNKDVEIKWGVHTEGEGKDEWVPSEKCQSIAILVSGCLKMEFCDQTVELKEPGGYVMWGEDIDHKWHCLRDIAIITVGWPSIHKQY